MHHINIKQTIRKQLKKQFPNWKLLTKKQKKDISKKALDEAVAKYDFPQIVETSNEELFGIEGQLPTNVTPLNEKVYNVLSERLRDTYNVFGSLPDTIDDDWIDNEEELKGRMDEYIHERKKAQDAFSVKYRSTPDPEAHLWERCALVLSRRDIVNKLSEPW